MSKNWMLTPGLMVYVRSAIIFVVGLWPPIALPEDTIEKDIPASPHSVENSIGMKMVLVPSGEFQMGLEEAPIDPLYAFPYASLNQVNGQLPQHRVRITKAFYMSAHETTLREFLTFYHAAKYKTEAERDGESSMGHDAAGNFLVSNKFRPWQHGWQQTQDHPVIYVSWNDAVAFCKWLSQKERKRYRLPTEAEWEYACRAGSTTRFSYGNDPSELVSVANVLDQDHNDWVARTQGQFLADAYRQCGWYLSRRDGHVFTAPVGKFRPNAFGLYDMHGNVREWCQDWYDQDY